jgi:hypothetical protein
MRERKDTLLTPHSPPPIPSAVELLGVAHGPTLSGWTLCPAQARSSWIIRGACPLHDFEEVGTQMGGQNLGG